MAAQTTLGGTRPEIGPVWDDHAGTRRRRLDTPAQLMIVVGLVVALLAATAAVTLASPAAAEALGRDAAADTARNSTSAREIYGGLADTDVAAGAMFLAEDEARRSRQIGVYVAAADRVQRAISAAQVHAYDDPGRLSQLTTVADELRVYRRVVDDGIVVGYGDDFAVQAVLASAYAREASHYMAEVLLPSVRRLAADDQERLAGARRDGLRQLIAAVLLPVLTLLALAAAQWWLWRRTRRRLNAGLLAATGAVVATLGLVLASWSHWPAADDGFAGVAALMQRQAVTQERLGEVLSGRADLYLALGAGVDPSQHQRDFAGRGLCGDAVDEVDCEALDGVWTARQSGDAGAYASAVGKVLASGAVAGEFDEAARSLTDRLAQGERDVDAAVARLPEAPRQHRFLLPGLLAVAAVTAMGGLAARLVEYY